MTKLTEAFSELQIAEKNLRDAVAWLSAKPDRVGVELSLYYRADGRNVPPPRAFENIIELQVRSYAMESLADVLAILTDTVAIKNAAFIAATTSPAGATAIDPALQQDVDNAMTALKKTSSK
jgi:hypothetical protein